MNEVYETRSVLFQYKVKIGRLSSRDCFASDAGDLKQNIEQLFIMYTTTRRNAIQKFGLVTLRTSDTSPAKLAEFKFETSIPNFRAIFIPVYIPRLHYYVYALRGVSNDAGSRASSDIILSVRRGFGFIAIACRPPTTIDHYVRFISCAEC